MNRQMRGEDLHGLNIEELQRLETMLEQGLSRVLQTKVSISCFLCRACVHCWLGFCKVSKKVLTFSFRATGL